MSVDLVDLVDRAERAVPVGRKCATAELFPIYQRLLARGFLGPAAVDWLVEQGAVERREKDRVYHALRHRALRLARKGVRP